MISMFEDDLMNMNPEHVLSPKEVEVLRLLNSGLTVKDIAARLGKTVSTVSRQKYDAMLKLGLKNDKALFDYLRENSI